MTGKAKLTNIEVRQELRYILIHCQADLSSNACTVIERAIELLGEVPEPSK